MAKIALIALYDSWALGQRILSNSLKSFGHEVYCIHMKLPVRIESNTFIKNKFNYEQFNSKSHKYKFTLSSFNYDIEPWTKYELYLLNDILLKINPNIVGVSSRSVYDTIIQEITQCIPQNMITICGGFGPTLNPELYAKYFDYVCFAEGEKTLCEIANAVDSNSDIKKINGIGYFENGKFLKNPFNTFYIEKDFFYIDGCENIQHFIINKKLIIPKSIFRYFSEKNPSYDTGSYVTMLGRGCVNYCSFCAAHTFHTLRTKESLFYPRRILRNIDDIINECIFAKKCGFKSICFMDSFFIAPISYMKKFLNLYKKEIALPFFAQFHPVQAVQHPELIHLAFESGLRDTVIAFQSACDDINKYIYNRPISIRLQIEFAQMLEKMPYSFNCDYHFIVCNPFESIENFQQTIELIYRLPKDERFTLVLQRLQPFFGTKLYELMKNNISFNLEDHLKRTVLLALKYTVDDKTWNSINKSLTSNMLIEIYNDFVNPTHKEFDEAKTLYYLNKFSESKDILYKIYEIDKNIYILSLLGWCLLQLGEYKKSIDIFYKAIDFANTNENRNEIYRGIAQSHFYINLYEEAKNFFILALKNINKEEYIEIARCLAWLAKCYKKLGNIHKTKRYLSALSHFKKYIDVNEYQLMRYELSNHNLYLYKFKLILKKIFHY